MTDEPLGLGHDEAAGVAVGEAGVALASQLRAHAARLAVETKRFDLPGWNGQLVVEVKRPSRQESRRAQSVPGILESSKAVLAVATVQVIVVDGEAEQCFDSWTEFGSAMMSAPDGTTASDVIDTVLPAEQLLMGLLESMGDWARGQAALEDDQLGE